MRVKGVSFAYSYTQITTNLPKVKFMHDTENISVI